MGFRFQRRIRIARGARLNLSKPGIGASVGSASRLASREQDCLTELFWETRLAKNHWLYLDCGGTLSHRVGRSGDL